MIPRSSIDPETPHCRPDATNFVRHHEKKRRLEEMIAVGLFVLRFRDLPGASL
jgi:hypothetical protein